MEILSKLSYQGRARSGLAGVVGISKAVLLLSDGRVGPAFDSQVRGHLNIAAINNAAAWIEALQVANQDIHAFEVANATTLQQLQPQITLIFIVAAFTIWHLVLVRMGGNSVQRSA